VDVFAATLGTLDVSLLIFRKAEDHFKRLFAILAVELITRHGNLRIAPEDMNLYSTVYARVAVVSRQEESTEEGEEEEKKAREKGREKQIPPLRNGTLRGSGQGERRCSGRDDNVSESADDPAHREDNLRNGTALGLDDSMGGFAGGAAHRADNSVFGRRRELQMRGLGLLDSKKNGERVDSVPTAPQPFGQYRSFSPSSRKL
jgi:hypothetical protein